MQRLCLMALSCNILSYVMLVSLYQKRGNLRPWAILSRIERILKILSVASHSLCDQLLLSNGYSWFSNGWENTRLHQRHTHTIQFMDTHCWIPARISFTVLINFCRPIKASWNEDISEVGGIALRSTFWKISKLKKKSNVKKLITN